ncbi:MAG: MFS transporter [Chlorobium sp.]|nr:MFS transporter [Chlorobium sp.]MCW8960474.1 MFS transporter [Ignavibacteriaceae bacterium]
MKLDKISGSNRLKMMFRSLRHKNFRLFVEGQSLSLIGTWLQMVALTWLVYKMTNSALMLGIVGFAGQLPMFVVAPFAGVFADRWNRHKMLLLTQSFALLQAVLLTILVFLNVIQIWHIIILSIILGLINAFDMPIRQAFVFDMIEDHKEDVGNAIALNSSMVNAARLIGPSIAGILIATVGEGWCFLVNSISFIAVVVSLLRMQIKTKPKPIKDFKIYQQLKEGFSYSFNFAPIKNLILLLALVSLFSTSVTLLAPVIAKDYLKGSADTYGFLIAAYGSGALLGAIYLLNKKNVLGLGRLIALAVTVFGTSLIFFGFSRIFFLSSLLMFFAGTGMMLQIASTNTLLQTISEENKRGRVMSFYTMAFRGMSPFGSLIAGSLGNSIGAPATLVLSGGISLIGVFVFYLKLPGLRKVVRPIYENLGILPQLASGVQSAAESAQRKVIE